MNIARDLAQFLEDNGFGVFGTDLFIGGAPVKVSTCYWITSAGGTNKQKNVTNNKLKNYTLSIFYRNTDAETVYENMQALEELINSDACTQLDNYDTIEMETILFPADQDIDVQDRTVGLLEVTITTHL